MNPDLILSLTKWQSNSMCLVLACWTRLDARAIVEILSHRILTGVGTDTCKSLRREHSQVISAKALYSASVEDLKIRGCFFEYHNMGDFS